jgi:hypothetical protein
MEYKNPDLGLNLGHKPSINVTEGLAGFDPNGWKKLQSGDVKSAFGTGGNWQDTFKIGANPSITGGLSFAPDAKPSMFSKLSGGFDKIGGLAGIGTLLQGFGAFQQAGVQKDQLELERANNLFNQGLAMKNFDTQAQTINTQMTDRQNTRNDRGSAVGTAEYMKTNGLSGY